MCVLIGQKTKTLSLSHKLCLCKNIHEQNIKVNKNSDLLLAEGFAKVYPVLHQLILFDAIWGAVFKTYHQDHNIESQQLQQCCQQCQTHKLRQ